VIIIIFFLIGNFCKKILNLNNFFYIGVVTLNGLLYVFGGEKVKNPHHCSIEVYDPNTNTWSMKILPKVNEDFQIYKGVVVNKPPNFITN